MNPESFFNWIGNAAAAFYGSGLFPSVLLAQAALESGFGKSELAHQHNNLFGIKAGKDWEGETVNLPTREVIDGKDVWVDADFRKYASVSDSIKDRKNFLKKNIRYSIAGVFKAKTPEAQAVALQDAGYATDPTYAKTIIALIRKHNLTRFDVIGKKKDSQYDFTCHPHSVSCLSGFPEIQVHF